MTRASKTTKKAVTSTLETGKELLSGSKSERAVPRRSIGTRATTIPVEIDESSRSGDNKRKSTPIISTNPKDSDYSNTFSPELGSHGKSRSKNGSSPRSDGNGANNVMSGSKQDLSGIIESKSQSSKKRTPPSNVKSNRKVFSNSKHESTTTLAVSFSEHFNSDTSTSKELPNETISTTIFGGIKGKTLTSSSKNYVESNTESIISTQPLFTEDNVQCNNVDFDLMNYKEIQQYIKDNSIKIKQGAKSKKDLIIAIKTSENAKLLNIESPVFTCSNVEILQGKAVFTDDKSNDKVGPEKLYKTQSKVTASVEKYTNELFDDENGPNSLKKSPVDIMKESRNSPMNIVPTHKINDGQKSHNIQSENSDSEVDPIRNIALDAISRVKCGGNELSQHEFTAIKLFFDRIKPKEFPDTIDGNANTKSSCVDSSSNFLFPFNGISPHSANKSSLQSYYSVAIPKASEIDRRLSYEGGWKSRESFLPSPSLALFEEHRYAGSVSKNTNAKVLVVPSSGSRNTVVVQPNLMLHNNANRNVPHHIQSATPSMANYPFAHTPSYSNTYHAISANNSTNMSVPLHASPMNTYFPLCSTIGKKRNIDVSSNQQVVNADYKRPRLPEDFKIQDSNSIVNRLSSSTKMTSDNTPNIVSRSIKSLPPTPFNLSVKSVENNTPKGTDISSTNNTKSSLSFIERRRLLRAKIGKASSVNAPPTGTAKCIIEAISESRNAVSSISPVSSNVSKSSASNKIEIAGKNSRLERDIKPAVSNKFNMKLTKGVDSNSDEQVHRNTNIKPILPTAGLNTVPTASSISFFNGKISKDEESKSLLLSSSDTALSSILKRTESSGKSVTFEMLPIQSSADIESSNSLTNNKNNTPLNKNAFSTAVNPLKKVEIGTGQGINAKISSKNNDEFEFGSPILIDGVDNNSDCGSSSDIKFMFSPPKSHMKQKVTPLKTLYSSQQPPITSAYINTAPPVHLPSKAASKDTANLSTTTVDLWALAAKSESVKCHNCLVSNKKGAIKCASCEAEVCSECKMLSFDSDHKKCKNNSCVGPVQGNQKSTAESSALSSMPDWATQPVKTSTVSTGPFIYPLASTPQHAANTGGPFTVSDRDAKLNQISSNDIGFLFGVATSNKGKEEGPTSLISSSSANFAYSANSTVQFTPLTANTDPLISLQTPKISNPTFGVTNNSANNSSFKVSIVPSSGSSTSVTSSAPAPTTVTPFNIGGGSITSSKAAPLPDNSATTLPFKFEVSGIELIKAVDNSPIISVSAATTPFAAKSESTSAPLSTVKAVNVTASTSVIRPFSFEPIQSTEIVKEFQTSTTAMVPFVFTGVPPTTQLTSIPMGTTAKERTSSHGSDSPNSRMDMDGDSPHIVSAALNTSSAFRIPPTIPTSTSALFTLGTKSQVVPPFSGISSNSNVSSNIFSSSSALVPTFSSTTLSNPGIFGPTSSQPSALSYGNNLPALGQSASTLGSSSNQQSLNPSSSNGSISGFGDSGSNIFSIGTAPKEGERKMLRAKKPNRS